MNVSVVVPIYNGEADLQELIECLRSQSYPSEEVAYFLVDNNSSDRTKSIIATAAENWSAIRPLTENKIQSSYAARNAGIRAATTEIIAFTDADCRPQSQWLEKIIEPFSDNNVGIVAGEIVALSGETILEKHADRQNTLSQKHTLANPFCPYGQTANLAIRRDAFQRVGLFRPYLTTGGDADICWRILQETSYQLKLAEEAIVKHRHRSTFGELRSQWQRYGKSNRYLHELYGVDLMRDLTAKEYVHRWSRWFLKELPVAAVKAVLGKADLVDFLKTPIDLFNAGARSQGQKEAKLPEEARQIDRF